MKKKGIALHWQILIGIGLGVVAGILLCKITPVVPNPVPHYALVYVYENLEGGAEITQTIDLDVGALCTYGA